MDKEARTPEEIAQSRRLAEDLHTQESIVKEEGWSHLEKNKVLDSKTMGSI